MLMVGGPATCGPGLVVEKSRTEEDMRSHTDIQKGAAPRLKAAQKFYQELAARAAASSHVVDVFACALDQVGLYEMRSIVDQTGGLVAMAESFTQSVFKESLRRVFGRHPDDAPGSNAGAMTMGFAATLECVTSRDVKIAGAIGPCSSLRRKSPHVSETEIGQGGTNAWSMGGVDPDTTLRRLL